jgi:hypothetical protein
MAEAPVDQLSSVSVKVVGMSYVGRQYEKTAAFRRHGAGYKMSFTCLASRRDHCRCATAANDIGQPDMNKLLEFVATLTDGGEAATCCDHPWTEIDLTYSAGRRRQKITVRFDLRFRSTPVTRARNSAWESNCWPSVCRTVRSGPWKRR